MNNRLKIAIVLVVINMLQSMGLFAQGPSLEFLYNQNTKIDWLKANVSLGGGASYKINLLPVIDKSTRSPLGSSDYTTDVNVESMLCYLPLKANLSDTINLKPYLKGNVVFARYDKLTEKTKFIKGVKALGAKALLLYSKDNKSPMLNLNLPELLDFPVYTLSSEAASILHMACGSDEDQLYGEDTLAPIKPRMPIASMKISVDSKFEKLKRGKIELRFNMNRIPIKSMENLLEVNSKAFEFLESLFVNYGFDFKEQKSTYFAGYDDKLFYTLHWGKGLATDSGIYSVYDHGTLDYSLAVHEMTHTLFYTNIGGSSSFLGEGVAMYAEAACGDKNKNHKNAIKMINNKEFNSLDELLNIDIGSDSKTAIGYTVSGSFVGFLIEKYGSQKFLKLWTSYHNFESVYGKKLSALESEWRDFLSKVTN